MIHNIDVNYYQEIETENDYIELEAEISIDFAYHGPIHGGRSEPSYGADVEFVKCEMLMGRTWVPAPKYIAEWAEDWLHGDGRDTAIQKAEDDLQPDPDRHYDMREDDDYVPTYARAA